MLADGIFQKGDVLLPRHVNGAEPAHCQQHGHPADLLWRPVELRGKDQERIFLHMFRQDGPELDRPLDGLSVKCDQGATRFLFDL